MQLDDCEGLNRPPPLHQKQKQNVLRQNLHILNADKMYHDLEQNLEFKGFRE